MNRPSTIHAVFFSLLLISIVHADNIPIIIHADKPREPAARLLTGVCLEDVNHEVYGGLYSQLIFGESFQEPVPPGTDANRAISGMWHAVTLGSAAGSFALDSHHPFVGSQSQQITFQSGAGKIGIDNRGLNGWGMYFAAGKLYDGFLIARTDAPTKISVTLQNADASKTLNLPAGDWTRLNFNLTPNSTDHAGSFAITLTQPGSATIGYALVEPGPWGRFHDLPIRKDIADALLGPGIDVIRYGGSMVNSPEYKWKNMVGPREHRPPYAGHWYPFSTNGFGVIDFLNFCEAANVLPVPDLSVNESPGDIADFIEYVNGSPDTLWGRKRAADGHPAPYHLTHLELGNEERVDDDYADKFSALAKSIWSKDPDITLIVGDFAYQQKITDPDHIAGADSNITNMNAHRRILDLARDNNREVWFDVHVWSEFLTPSPYLVALPSYIDAIDHLASGAKHKVVCFELNANTHNLTRALANAISINTIRRDNRMPIVTSANALQPDGQNNNGWDQGLVFFNPSEVWRQPPLDVMRMQPRIDPSSIVPCDVPPGSVLDVAATRSTDGKTLIFQVINPAEAQTATISLPGFTPTQSTAHTTELTGPLDATNTSTNPGAIHALEADWPYKLVDGKLERTFAPHSLTVIRFE